MRHIDSVEALEVLLYLFQHRDRRCTTDDLAKALYSTANSIALRLDVFQKKGLVTVDKAAFQYAATGDADRTIGRLAECYPTFRLRIIEMIYSRRQGFEYLADAFRIKKDDENG